MPEASLALASTVIGWVRKLPAAGLVIASAGGCVSTSTPPASVAVATAPLALRNCTEIDLLPSPSETMKLAEARPLLKGWNAPLNPPVSAMRYSVALMQATSRAIALCSKKGEGAARRTVGLSIGCAERKLP